MYNVSYFQLSQNEPRDDHWVSGDKFMQILGLLYLYTGAVSSKFEVLRDAHDFYLVMNVRVFVVCKVDNITMH